MSVTTGADVHPAGHLRAVLAALLLACTPRTGGQAAVQSQHSDNSWRDGVDLHGAANDITLHAGIAPAAAA